VPQLVAAIVLAIAALFTSTPAGAQSSPSSSPGPYVIDIRAPMSGLPSGSAFLPVLPANALVPKRGFGLGLGGHVYVASLGIARVGVGVDALRVRGKATTPAPATATTTTTTTSSTTPRSALSARDQIDVVMTTTAIAPQVSFNFGTSDGWSYLSAGYGAAEIRPSASGTPLGPLHDKVTLARDDGRAAALNYGGGARWFIRGHLAVGFDLRFHRVAAAGTRPGTKLTVLSAGVSVR
jgi:hypothetical protein